MCLFLDVNLNASTWTIILVGISLGAVILGLFGQYKAITHDLQEEKCKSETIRCMEVALYKLKKDVSILKEGVKESEKEVKNVEGEIKLLKSDKTGLVDFAYKGEVVSIRNTETFVSERTASSVGFVGLCGQLHLERRILESDVMPGDCWPIRGQEGAAVIALTGDVIVTKVTLEHASRSLLSKSTLLATPKQFSLWGLQDENYEESGTAHLFGRFEYSLANPEVQSFFVVHPSNNTFRFVEFKVHSNHGHPDFTCVYRVRVHGHLA